MCAKFVVWTLDVRLCYAMFLCSMESGMIYDFYFSEKQRQSIGIGYSHTINGLEYTECVPHGEKPFVEWDDFILVCSGFSLC